MSPTDTERESGKLASCLLWALAFFMVYALSSGPMFRLSLLYPTFFKQANVQKCVRVVCYPLGFVVEKPPFKQVWSGYMRLWGWNSDRDLD